MSISEEIRASAAAHRDLGANYDTAVAEGLVERIGEEIDRRVDARLTAHLGDMEYEPRPRPRPRSVRMQHPQAAGRVGFGAVVLALGSMGLAIGATGAILHPGDGGRVDPAGPLIALVWIVIGIINVAYARRR